MKLVKNQIRNQNLEKVRILDSDQVWEQIPSLNLVRNRIWERGWASDIYRIWIQIIGQHRDQIRIQDQV